MGKTVNYYNENAKRYFDSTVDGNVSDIRDDFLSYIPEKGEILDLGCGSGRDTKEFASKGYRVMAIDGSKRLCLLASEYTNLPVHVMKFNDVFFPDRFDGIWACASLLHIPKKEMIVVMNNLSESLKEDGMLYVSLKEGKGTNFDGNRFYQYYNIKEYKEIIDATPGLKLIKTYPSKSVTNANENRVWNNYFIKKQ